MKPKPYINFMLLPNVSDKAKEIIEKDYNSLRTEEHLIEYVFGLIDLIENGSDFLKPIAYGLYSSLTGYSYESKTIIQ